MKGICIAHMLITEASLGAQCREPLIFCLDVIFCKKPQILFSSTQFDECNFGGLTERDINLFKIKAVSGPALILQKFEL